MYNNKVFKTNYFSFYLLTSSLKQREFKLLTDNKL